MERAQEILQVCAWVALIVAIALPWFVGLVTLMEIISDGIDARKK